MPKILIIKTSSLGDVVHMLPAINDATQRIENLQVDWVVEEGFKEVPAWSTTVDRVFAVAIRRWRKSLFSSKTRQEIKKFKNALKANEYDFVIDSQGLLKSALLTRWTKAKSGIWGYDKKSIREPIASFFYQHKVSVSRELHAITRNRQLLAKTLGYSLEGLDLDYNLSTDHFSAPPIDLPKKYIVALHGTSKAEKEWSIHAWKQLIQKMAETNIAVLFPWGNPREKERAELLSDQSKYAIALPKCNLSELATIISNAQAVIGMDTGLMHIAAALNKRGVGLYPVTKPTLTGVLTGGDTNLIDNISGKKTRDIDSIIEKIITLIND